jgi:hypothetical protein
MRLESQAMYRLPLALLILLAPTVVHADRGVFDVCKGESKRVVAGTGQLSIALVFPDDFPGRTTREVLFPIGEALAQAEHARVILVADVDAAIKLARERHWSDKANACGTAPAFAAVLGQKFPNLSTAHVSIACDDKCELHVDLERHGRPTAERWVRYVAPLSGDKASTKVIAAAGAKLVAKGVPPDAPHAGLAVSELADGSVTTRSDADGALDLDRTMESDRALAACRPKQRRPHDIRGWWADWKLSALGTAMEVQVKPFGGVDKADEDAATCIRNTMQRLQFACPRDSSVATVKTAICM